MKLQFLPSLNRLVENWLEVYFFKNKLLKTVFTLSLLFSFVWSVDYEGRVVEQILVEGTTDVSVNQIKRFLPFEEGDKLTQTRMRRGLQRLFSANFIEDVKFDVTEGDEGIIFTVILQSHREIENMYTVGNEVFNDVTILQDIKASQKQYFIRNEMNSIKFGIINKYYEKGYLDVSIDYISEPSPDDPEKVDVTFLIREGAAYIVKEINFTGITNIDPDEVKGFIQTREESFFSSTPFNPNAFETDKERISYFFRTKGHYKARILDVNFEYKWEDTELKEKKYVTINIDVELGEVYYFGKYLIKGNTLFTEEELTYDFKRTEGETFNQIFHDQDVFSIYQKYQQNGYIFARITPQENFVESNRIDFVFNIYEGDKARIESIFVRGLTKTKENVVTREFKVREGEIFDVDRINLTLYRLNRLGYFAEVDKDYRNGSAEGLMSLNFIVKEKSTGKLSGGFTYGLSSGFSLIADYSDINFLGRGYSMAVKARFGFNIKDLTFTFTDPWFQDNPISLGGSFTLGKYYLDYKQDLYPTNSSGAITTVQSPDGGDRGFVNNSASAVQYTRDKISFSVFSGQRFWEWYEVYEAFGMDITHDYLDTDTIWPENYTQLALYNANTNLFSSPPPINDPWKLTYILTLGLARDSRNSLINPTEGFYNSLRAKFYLGGYEFTDWSFDNAFYATLPTKLNGLDGILWKLTGAYKFTLKTLGRSIAGNFNSDSYYQLTETKLRGWKYNDILQFRRERFGSEGLLDNRAYFQAYMLHTLEIRQNIATDLIQLTLFADFAGVSHNKLSLVDTKSWSFLYNFSDFMNSTGFGVRINFPQLPIRFYWAWKFIYDDRIKSLVNFNQEDGFPVFVFDIQGAF